MNFATVIAGFALLAQVNAYRADHQLPAFTISPETCIMAMERINDVPTEWSHKGFYRRLTEPSFDGGYWGENLAKDFTTPAEVVAAWDASPLHKANLLSPMNEGCFAHKGNYWVMEIHETHV